MRRLRLLAAVLTDNWFYYNLDALGTLYYSLTGAWRNLLKGIYTYKYLLLTFLLKSPVIINKCYTLFISLYKR